MSTVATISIKLDAQTAALKQGFAEMRSDSRSLGSQLKQSLGGGIVKINAALGVMREAFNAAASAVRNLMATVDEVADLGDFADRIQISTERLQELHLVTEQWGGAAGVMNTALQRMQRRIADAARAGGPLADRLEAVGLSVEHLATLSADEQFLAVADAVRALGTSGDQTALVMALMDTEGVALTETLRQGSDALREQMGLYAEHHTLTDQEIKDAQQLSADMKIVNAQWETATKRLKLEFIPALIELLGVLSQIADWFSENSKDMQAVFGVGGGGEMQVLEGFEERQKAAKEARDAELKALGDVMRGMKTYKKELSEVAEVRAAALGAPLNIPGVGAVTSTTAQGFSALHDAQRRAQARAAWEKDVLGLLADIRDDARAAPRAVPVSIV